MIKINNNNNKNQNPPMFLVKFAEWLSRLREKNPRDKIATCF